MTPKMKAVVATPSSGQFEVWFRFLDSNKRVLPGYPTVCLPCHGYEHACAVADAYNAPEIDYDPMGGTCDA